MKILELRGFLKERGIRGFSMMKKSELEAKVQEIKGQERAEKYEQNLRDTALCSACLEQQKIKRAIDDKTFNQRLLESAVRTLVCEYCKHAILAKDGDDTFCVLCGALQSPDAEGGYRISSDRPL